MLLAALDVIARGLGVLPLHTPMGNVCSCWKGGDCRSVGKHPRLDEWKRYQERRPTELEVRGWWARWPDANIGIITGMVSGLAVLDIDPRNGGLDTLADLDAYGAVMPEDNPLVETGSPGLHHYFALDAPLPKAAPFLGIELQADGGLVVAPPSFHRSGRRYAWLRDLASALPPLPAWVRWACARVTAAPERVMLPLPDAGADDVLGVLAARGFYLGRHRRTGLHRVRCPWSAEHSGGDPEAVVVEPGASLAPGWAFRCLHSHCSERGIGALLDVLGIARRRA
jgi:hypothetical protein